MTMDIEVNRQDRRASEGMALIATTAETGAGNGPWRRLRAAVRTALSERMSMETSDLAHRIRRIHDQPDTTQ